MKTYVGTNAFRWGGWWIKLTTISGKGRDLGFGTILNFQNDNCKTGAQSRILLPWHSTPDRSMINNMAILGVQVFILMSV